jgi:thiol-disulfide isomerase/thioredoxin
MKNLTACLLLILTANYCFGQEIDKDALAIMEKSFDKIANLNIVKYNLIFKDTMLRAPNPMITKQTTINGLIKKKAYWYLSFEDKARWLIQADTLFKREGKSLNSLSYLTNWSEHEIGKYSIYNLLGNDRSSFSSKNVASLKFVQDTSLAEFYVIDEVRIKRDFKTDEVQDVKSYNRHWINKSTLLPMRRTKYSETIQNKRQAIDIYDFAFKIEELAKAPKEVTRFFDSITVVTKEKEADSLKINSAAPMFSAVNLDNSKIITLNDLKGKVVLLDFWYMSCMPCRILTPKIQKLHEKFAKQNVAVIGVNLIDTSSQEIKAFLKKKQITFPQYYKAANLAKDYKLYAYPTIIIVGKGGKIKLVELGFNDDIETRLEQLINVELTKSI